MSIFAPYREGLAALDTRARFVVASSFLVVAGRMSLLTFLSIFLVDSRGLDLAIIGLAFLVENLARAFVAPFGGALSDRIGRRPLLVGSALLTGLLTPAILLVHDGPSLLLWSALVGAAQGPYFPTSAAILLDLAPEARRQSVLATNYTLVSLGYTLGVAPAGFLAQLGFGFLAFASGALFLVVALLVMVGVRRLPPMEERPRTTFLADLTLAPRDPSFLLLALVGFVFPLGIGLVSLATPVYADDLGLPQGIIGLVLGSTGVVLILLAIPVTARTEHKGPFTLLPLAALLIAPSYAVLALWPDAAGLFVGVTLFTLGEAIFSSALPTAVASLAPPGRRGAYQGVWGSLYSAGIGSALLLSGLLRDAMGWPGTWLAFSAATFVAAAGLWAARPWFRRVRAARQG